MNQLIQALDPQLLAEGDTDPRYLGSPFVNLLRLGPKVRGTRYERITIQLMQQVGHDYQPRTHSDHDARFDGVSYEIKGGMLNRNTDHFSFLQIRPNQLYDAMLFAMFYPHRVILMSMAKQQVIANVDSGQFRPQHGGVHGHSHTYVYYGNEHSLRAIGAQLLHEIE